MYCPEGNFYIDPWAKVDTAIITHAHADHARAGSKKYISHKDSESILRLRLGNDIHLETHEYKKEFIINGISITLFPAGHTIGSSLVRIRDDKETWVITGDFKLHNDTVSTPFQITECDVLVTESTFALPVYNWEPQDKTVQEINYWWKSNARQGITSVLTCYAFGKAQRLLSLIDASIGSIFTHGAIFNTTNTLKQAGFRFPEFRKPHLEFKNDFRNALVLAPSSAIGTNWIKRFKNKSIASASGWMQIRGIRRRRGFDRGFVLSDHADWNGILQVIRESKAKHVITTHGYTSALTKYLREIGISSSELSTPYSEED